MQFVCLRIATGNASSMLPPNPERSLLQFRPPVPPGDPVILDEDGRRLEGLVGRFNEGENLRLVCEVEGGNGTQKHTTKNERREKQ